MKVKVHGFEMAYEDTGGSGTPLLLIHGFPLDRTLWSAQTRALTDVARVIAPDLRGFGESGQPAGAVTVDTYADDLRGLLDALGVKNAVVGGLSMGGYIAFAFYRAYAHRVRALILADTRALPDSPEGKQGRDKSIAAVREKGASAVADAMMPKMLTPKMQATNAAMTNTVRAMMMRQPVEGIASALAALRDRPDSTPTLAQIAAPTQIIVGAEDTLTPPQDSEMMRDAIHDARLALIPGAAHLSCVEQADEFNRIVREFLKTV